jgi:hypothetical protein
MRDIVSTMLQVTAQKRFGRGLFFLIGDTNSKQLTNVGSFQGQGYSISQARVPTNSQINAKFLAQLDRPQNLSLRWVHQLPFGPGKRFANTSNPLIKELVGGWQVTGLQQYTSGDYIALSTEQSIPGYFGGMWANRVSGTPILQSGCGNYDPNPTGQSALFRRLHEYIQPAHMAWRAN